MAGVRIDVGPEHRGQRRGRNDPAEPVRRIIQAVGALLAFLWLAVFVFMMIVVHSPKAEGKERFGMVHLRKGDVDTLARTLYGEARGEKKEGMQAVAWVILNRARRGPPRFPATISEVCKQRHQFTCWSDSDPNAKICAAVSEADPSFLLALHVATSVLGGLVPSPVGDADHYHTIKMKPYPSWAAKMKEVTRIGGHVFYLDKPVN